MKVESSTIHGFTVEEGIVEDTREYTLPSGLALLVGTQPKKIQADLAIASNDTTVDHDEFFAALKEARSIGLEVVIATDLEFNGPHAKSAEKALATKLKLHKHIIRPGFSKFFYGTFEDTNFVQLISQCSTPKKFPRFVQHCLKIAQTRAKHSTSKGEAPNYHTHIPNLIATLQEYTNVRLTRSGLPDIISGRTNFKTFGIEDLASDIAYTNAIVRENGSSFTYNIEMKQLAEKITEGISGEIEKSKAIFEWVATNIQYGSKKRKPRVIYRGALQVYQDKEGVCGESATLQVTLERLVGNKAFLVEVGEKHACAAHLKPDNTIILIETTHKNGYNTQYPDFKILSDDYSFTCTGYD